MAMRLAQVRELTDAEVEERYDNVADSTGDSLRFWRDEVMRRDQAKATKRMVSLTTWITAMTGVVAAATVVNVVLFALR